MMCADLWLERREGNTELVLLSPVLKPLCLPTHHKKLVMEKDCWHLLRSVASAARMALAWVLFVWCSTQSPNRAMSARKNVC